VSSENLYSTNDSLEMYLSYY